MNQKKVRLTEILSVMTFALLALCLMGVLLTGAGVYQRLVRSGRRNDDSRTAALYLTTRVHQAETVRLEDFCGYEALVFPQEAAGEAYLTRVYCHEGWMKELYCSAEASLTPADGERLFPLERLDMVLKGNCLKLDTGDYQLVFTLPAGRRMAS